MTCSIAGIGTALPDTKLTAEALATAGGADAGALRLQLGIEALYVPASDVSPWHLCTGAARSAMSDAGVRAEDVDLVMTFGRTRYEYICWALSLAVMKELGIERASGADFSDFTGGTLLTGLRVVRARFAADPRPQTVLLTAHQRASDLVDRSDASAQRLWPVADGGAALVLRRDGTSMQPLAGAFASDVPPDAGIGLRSLIVDDGPDPSSFFDHEWAMAKFFSVRDPDRWWSDFRQRAVAQLPQVIGRAVQRSGLSMDQIAHVQCGFLAPDVAEGVRDALGVGGKLSVHNAHGMMAGTELGFALQALRGDASLRGKHVVLAGACLPGHFGAMVLRV